MRFVSDVLGVVIALTLVASEVGPAHGALLLTLDDPLNRSGGGFGSALVGVGTRLAVGVPGTPVLDQDGAGVVQLYGSDGTLQRTIEALNPAADAGFGSKLAATDDILYVSAPRDPSTGVGATGAVYVFDPATGRLLRTLRAPGPNTGTAPVGGGPGIPGVPGSSPGVPQSTASLPETLGFGLALTAVGDHLLVGAPDSSVDGLAGAGAVYEFDARGALVRTLREFSPHANAAFGASMTVIGGVLFVGAPGAPAGGVDDAGVVRAFDAATGASILTLRSALPVEGAAFGAIVAQIGGTLSVSAPGDLSLGVASGVVYLFDAKTFALQKIITPLTPAAGLDFGGAVLTIGGNLLVGADGASPDQSGKAYLIDPVTSEVRTIFQPTIARNGGAFGFALGTVASVIVIGEPAPGTSGRGRVYLFDLSTQPTAPVPPPTSPTSPPPTRPIASPAPVPPSARCVPAATTASVACRLGTLLQTLREMDLQPLARPLRRALREVLRANAAGGGRRARAEGRALRGLDEFARRLEAAGERIAVPAEVKESLAGAASSVESDLRTLSVSAAALAGGSD